MMKKKLFISICLLMSFLLVQAQTTSSTKKTVLEAFTDTLQEMSASYFAYHRMWDDLDIPTPRVKLKADYHKLIVPPTYYFAPVQQAFELDWEPSDKMGMDAVDTDTFDQSKSFPKGINARIVEVALFLFAGILRLCAEIFSSLIL